MDIGELADDIKSRGGAKGIGIIPVNYPCPDIITDRIGDIIPGIASGSGINCAGVIDNIGKCTAVYRVIKPEVLDFG